MSFQRRGAIRMWFEPSFQVLARGRRALAVALLFTLALGGCAGPDVTLNPVYQPSAELADVHGGQQAVSVAVIDARLDKGPVRDNGREVLAQGDKGKVFLETPVATAVHDFMVKALTAAGFDVKDGAPIVVEVTIVDLPLEAPQFTNWGLPSERASTLDALGAIVPGPVRETRAKATFSISIRKYRTPLGISRIVEQRASDVSADRAVIESTLSRAINQAIDKAVVQAAPDIQYVAKVPVSPQEIDGRVGQVEQQQQTIEQLRAQLATQKNHLADDAEALKQMRELLAADRAKVDAANAGLSQLDNERAQLNDAKQKLDQEQAANLASSQALDRERQELDSQSKALRAQLDQAAKDSEIAQQTQAQLAKLDEKQSAIEAQASELTAKKESLELQSRDLAAQTLSVYQQQQAIKAKELALRDREQNLATFKAKVDNESALNEKLAEQLKQENAELDKRALVLTQWKKDTLEKQHEALTPPPEVVQYRGPLIVLTDPATDLTDPSTDLSTPTIETATDSVTIKGTVADDRPLKPLAFAVNSENVAAAPQSNTRAANLPVRESGTSTVFSYTAENLREGDNFIEIRARDDSLTTVQRLKVHYTKGEGKLIVVSIGINDYSGGIPSLRYAEADATEVASMFREMTNLPPTVMLDATRKDITDELAARLPLSLQPADRVIIFFSGHGGIDDTQLDPSGTPVAYIFPCDAIRNQLEGTAIPMTALNRWLYTLKQNSTSVVFIADTCFSGNAVSQISTTHSPVPKPDGTGYAILTACTGAEPASEPDNLKHGIFTYYLLKGLQGEAMRDGGITLGDLYDYIKKKVDSATDHAQTPELGLDDLSAMKIPMAHFSYAMKGVLPKPAPQAGKPQ